MHNNKIIISRTGSVITHERLHWQLYWPKFIAYSPMGRIQSGRGSANPRSAMKVKAKASWCSLKALLRGEALTARQG